MKWYIAVYKDISKSKDTYIKPYFIEKELLDLVVEEVVIENIMEYQ